MLMQFDAGSTFSSFIMYVSNERAAEDMFANKPFHACQYRATFFPDVKM